MNIFVTSEDPKQCARMLDDQRLVKMVLETAQLLSTAMHLVGGIGCYRPTHANHPCTQWVAKCRGNYLWTLWLFDELCLEYENRYQRTHKCAEHRLLFCAGLTQMPPGGRTSFANCTPYKEMDAISAYRYYMLDKWTNARTSRGRSCTVRLGS